CAQSLLVNRLDVW
nr:immunoglobulin heavy chain junction region [Macaca mulatta]